MSDYLGYVKPTFFERFTDNFVGIFSPGAKRQRMMERMQTTRFASYPDYGSRLRNAIPRNLVLSPNTAKSQMDRIELMMESRYLSEFFWPLRAVKLAFAQFVVGTLDYEPATGDPDTDAEYDEYLKFRFRNCDATGRQSYREVAEQCVMQTLDDGDFFDLYLASNDGIRILAIEADRIGSPWATQVMKGYAGGIHVDDVGAEIGWRLYERTPFGAYLNPQDIWGTLGAPMTHFFKTMRHDAYRGVSHFESVTKVARDLEVTLEAEGIAVQFGSKRSGAIEIDPALDTGDDNPQMDTAEENNQPTKEQTWGPGSFVYLRKGERMHEFEVNRPTDGWMGFIELMLKAFASSQGLPAGFVFDMAMGAGPEVRLRSRRAERVFENWQHHLKFKRLDKHKNMLLMDGIARKQIRPSYNFTEGNWSFGAHPSIDAGRESAADLAENARGVTPLSVITSRDGRRARQTIFQSAQEAKWKQEAAAKFGVKVEDFSLMTANGNPSAAEPDGDEPIDGQKKVIDANGKK